MLLRMLVRRKNPVPQNLIKQPRMRRAAYTLPRLDPRESGSCERAKCFVRRRQELHRLGLGGEGGGQEVQRREDGVFDHPPQTRGVEDVVRELGQERRDEVQACSSDARGAVVEES